MMKKVFLCNYFMIMILIGCALETGQPLVPPTAAEDGNLPSISISVAGYTRTVHVRTFGNPENPVLLVAPGSLSDIRAYMPFQTFSDAYFVVLWDMRGNGLSERVTKNELEPEIMAQEIHVMKEYFSPEKKVTVIGHSWSANFLAIYCGLYPEDTIQAVLLEPTALHSDFTEGLNSVLNLTSVGYCDMNWFHASLTPDDHEKLDFSMLAMLESGVRDFFVDITEKPDWPVWRVGGFALIVWENSLLNSSGKWEYDHSAGLINYSNTVLLAGSSHSPIGYEFQEQYNAPLFPSAEVLRIEQSGHRIITEQWAALEEGLRNYLIQYQEKK
jgi:pimeloyl-ACP methyl ester carboxylesterase